MSILGIIFGQQRVVIGAKDTGLGGSLSKLNDILRQTIGGVAGIVIDATVSEEHLSECELTENPVEDGAVITDHVHIKPAQLTIQGVISDTPLGYAVVGNIQNIVRTFKTFGKSSRSTDAYNDLVKLQQSRQPFTVVTGLKKYDNMIMTSLSVPRTAQTGRSIHFTCVMRQIKIVKSKTSSSFLASSVKSIGAKIKDVGNKITPTVPANGKVESEVKKLQSPAHQIVNYTIGKARSFIGF